MSPGIKTLSQNNSHCIMKLMTRRRNHILFHSVHEVQHDDKFSLGPLSMFLSLIGEPEEPRHQTSQL
jgi:hypothetical protein